MKHRTYEHKIDITCKSIKLSYDSFVKTIFRSTADTAKGRIFAVSGRIINFSLAAPASGSTLRNRGGVLSYKNYVV